MEQALHRRNPGATRRGPGRTASTEALARGGGAQRASLAEVLTGDARGRRDGHRARAGGRSRPALHATTSRPSWCRSDLIERTPINFARQHSVLPIGREGIARDRGGGQPARPYPARRPAGPARRAGEGAGRSCSMTIERAINRVYERKDENALADSSKRSGRRGAAGPDRHDRRSAGHPLGATTLFYNAVRDRASDIHIEPTDKDVVVRYRIDGELYPVKHAHKGFLPSIVARVKIEAGLNIAEKRLPQDGRITIKIQGKLSRHARVHGAHRQGGERIVMRLLDKEHILLDLADLGFATHQLRARWSDLIHAARTASSWSPAPPAPARRPRSTRASTGSTQPTSTSSPSRTRSSTSSRASARCRCSAKIGLTFASGAARLPRARTPDVIMVGEIRDRETARDRHPRLAHRPPGAHHAPHQRRRRRASPRLVDMGVAAVPASRRRWWRCSAQRLVRRLCCELPRALLAERRGSSRRWASTRATSRSPPGGRYRLRPLTRSRRRR